VHGPTYALTTRAETPPQAEQAGKISADGQQAVNARATSDRWPGQAHPFAVV